MLLIYFAVTTMKLNATMTSYSNTLKKVYLSKTVLNEFTFTYDDDRNESFVIIFQQYTAIYVEFFYQPPLIE